MRRLVYDVAATLDNFVSHEDGGADGFVWEGDHVAAFLERLSGYDTVVMGRNTYEWGYRFGLVAGKRAYPHMRHYVFSRSMRPAPGWEIEIVDRDELEVIRRLKGEEGTDIYLCGGGAFAGFLLDHGLVDRLVVKLNPVLFGNGIRLFGPSTRQVPLKLVGTTRYSSGVVLLTYDLEYGRPTQA